MTQKLKTMKIIHLAICAGVCVAYFILGDFSNLNELALPEINAESSITLIIPVAAYLLSLIMYKTNLKKDEPSATLDQKIQLYQTSSIIRYAILEAAAFYLLIVQPEFRLLGIPLIVYMFFLHPTEDRFRRDLDYYDQE